MVHHCKIWYRFWVIWRWMTSWPWNLGSRSLKIIQTGTIRKLGCSFLFAFHSSYMALSCIISKITRDIGRKSCDFSYTLAFDAPFRRFTSEYCHPVWCGKTRTVGLDTIRARDGRTDILPRHSPRYAYASRGKNERLSSTSSLLLLDAILYYN